MKKIRTKTSSADTKTAPSTSSSSSSSLASRRSAPSTSSSSSLISLLSEASIYSSSSTSRLPAPSTSSSSLISLLSEASSIYSSSSTSRLPAPSTSSSSSTSRLPAHLLYSPSSTSRLPAPSTYPYSSSSSSTNPWDLIYSPSSTSRLPAPSTYPSSSSWTNPWDLIYSPSSTSRLPAPSTYPSSSSWTYPSSSSSTHPSSTSRLPAPSTYPSSSSSTHPWKYDVFLCFRGQDTRFEFADALFQGMTVRGIKVFRDDEGLQRGEKINPALEAAIKESRNAIVIVSPNFTKSKACRFELTKIMECRRKGRLDVFPVFYHTDPAHVPSVDPQLDKDPVESSRKALKELSNISAWVIPNQSYTALAIDKICREMLLNTKEAYQIERGSHDVASGENSISES